MFKMGRKKIKKHVRKTCRHCGAILLEKYGQKVCPVCGWIKWTEQEGQE